MEREDPLVRRRRLRQETLLAAGRIDAPAARSPGPGDLFQLAGGDRFAVEWLVVERHSGEPGLVLAVPADTHPLLGAADVAVPAGSAAGALSLRCGFPVWVREAVLAKGERTGTVEPEHVERARRRCEAIAAGAAPDDPLGEAADGDPEYRDWLAEAVVPARDALRPSPAVPVRRWVYPAVAAASVLLLLGAGLAGGIAWQARQTGRIAAERDAARREACRERQRADAAERRSRELAAGERQEGAVRRQPLVNLPLALLAPVEATRGPASPVRLPADAPYLLLVLEAGEAETFPSYRLDVIRAATGERVWRGERLTRSSLGEVTLALPRDLLSPGGYRLRLQGLRGDRAAPAAEYALSVAP